jgi:hypothetical protein
MTALGENPAEYLLDDNHDRAHTRRLTQGRVPADIVPIPLGRDRRSGPPAGALRG